MYNREKAITILNNIFYSLKETSKDECAEIIAYNVAHYCKMEIPMVYKYLLFISPLGELEDEYIKDILDIVQQVPNCCTEVQANIIKLLLTTEAIEPIEISNYIQLSDKEYLFSMSDEDLLHYYKTKRIVFDNDYDDYKIDNIYGKDLFIIKNRKGDSVSEIKNLILSKSYIFPEIYVSVTEGIREENGQLIICSKEMKIIDGSYTFKGLMDAMKYSRYKNVTVPIRLCLFDREEEKYLTWQNKRVCKDTIREVNELMKEANKIVDGINYSDNFKYYKQIKFRKGFIRYEQLAALIFDNFLNIDESISTNRAIKLLSVVLSNIPPTSIREGKVPFKILYATVRITAYCYFKRYGTTKSIALMTAVLNSREFKKNDFIVKEINFEYNSIIDDYIEKAMNEIK